MAETKTTNMKTSENTAEAVERKKVAADHERLYRDMGERIKELTCMYGVAQSIRDRKNMEEVFQDVLALIPPGWQYPEITRGKIRLDEREYVSEPFEETQWKQTANIVIHGQVRGAIEVYYIQACPALDEGPFLKEERNLIDGIAHAISEAIERKQAEAKRKQAEEETKQAKEQYETLVSNMPEAIYSALPDDKGTSVFMSERWGQWTGYNVDDPEIWQKSVHPDDRARTVKVYLQAAKEKKDYIIDYRVVHKDTGQIRWVSDHGSPIVDEKGNVISFDGIVTDITERKEAEAEREQLLKTIHRALSTSLRMT
ncbi:MAG: PAS domain-containing protein [Planctomycetota bacterium]|jgi:PAS domain S-box-containing protein